MESGMRRTASGQFIISPTRRYEQLAPLNSGGNSPYNQMNRTKNSPLRASPVRTSPEKMQLLSQLHLSRPGSSQQSRPSSTHPSLATQVFNRASESMKSPNQRFANKITKAAARSASTRCATPNYNSGIGGSANNDLIGTSSMPSDARESTRNNNVSSTSTANKTMSGMKCGGNGGPSGKSRNAGHSNSSPKNLKLQPIMNLLASSPGKGKTVGSLIRKRMAQGGVDEKGETTSDNCSDDSSSEDRRRTRAVKSNNSSGKMNGSGASSAQDGAPVRQDGAGQSPTLIDRLKIQHLGTTNLNGGHLSEKSSGRSEKDKSTKESEEEATTDATKAKKSATKCGSPAKTGSPGKTCSPGKSDSASVADTRPDFSGGLSSNMRLPKTPELTVSLTESRSITDSVLNGRAERRRLGRSRNSKSLLKRSEADSISPNQNRTKMGQTRTFIGVASPSPEKTEKPLTDFLTKSASKDSNSSKNSNDRSGNGRDRINEKKEENSINGLTSENLSSGLTAVQNKKLDPYFSRLRISKFAQSKFQDPDRPENPNIDPANPDPSYKLYDYCRFDQMKILFPSQLVKQADEGRSFMREMLNENQQANANAMRRGDSPSKSSLSLPLGSQQVKEIKELQTRPRSQSRGHHKMMKSTHIVVKLAEKLGIPTTTNPLEAKIIWCQTADDLKNMRFWSVQSKVGDGRASIPSVADSLNGYLNLDAEAIKNGGEPTVDKDGNLLFQPLENEPSTTAGDSTAGGSTAGTGTVTPAGTVAGTLTPIGITTSAGTGTITPAGDSNAVGAKRSRTHHKPVTQFIPGGFCVVKDIIVHSSSSATSSNDDDEGDNDAESCSVNSVKESTSKPSNSSFHLEDSNPPSKAPSKQGSKQSSKGICSSDSDEGDPARQVEKLKYTTAEDLREKRRKPRPEAIKGTALTTDLILPEEQTNQIGKIGKGPGFNGGLDPQFPYALGVCRSSGINIAGTTTEIQVKRGAYGEILGPEQQGGCAANVNAGNVNPSSPMAFVKQQEALAAKLSLHGGPKSYRASDVIFVNRFPQMYHITRKDLLVRNLSEMKKALPDEFDFTPPTFCISTDRTWFLRYCSNRLNPSLAKRFAFEGEKFDGEDDLGEYNHYGGRHSEARARIRLIQKKTGRRKLNRDEIPVVSPGLPWLNEDMTLEPGVPGYPPGLPLGSSGLPNMAPEAATQKESNSPSKSLSKGGRPGTSQSKRDGHGRDGLGHGEESYSDENSDYVEEKPKRLTFILKPSDGSQGHGIKLFQVTGDQLSNGTYLEDVEKRINSSDRKWVIQRYITAPNILESSRKWDARVYVVVTSTRPRLKAYLFDDGLARLATRAYECPRRSNVHDLNMHLTNFSVNWRDEGFENTVDEFSGSKRSLRCVLLQLERRYGISRDKLWLNVADVITKTLLAVGPKLSIANRRFFPSNNVRSFQLLGFDIMFHSDFSKCWLLEVNHDPSLSTKTYVDRIIKGKLVSQIFQLLGCLPARPEDDLTVESEDEFRNNAIQTPTHQLRVGSASGVKRKGSGGKVEQPDSGGKLSGTPKNAYSGYPGAVASSSGGIQPFEIDLSSSEFSEFQDETTERGGFGYPRTMLNNYGSYVTENFTQILPVTEAQQGADAVRRAEKIHQHAKVSARKWLEFSSEHLFEESNADNPDVTIAVGAV